MRKDRFFVAYFISGAAYVLWQTSNTLASNQMLDGAGPFAYDMVFVAHYFVAGAAMLGMGLLCDIGKIPAAGRRAAAGGLAAAATALTLLRWPAAGTVWFLPLYLLATLCGYAVHTLLLFDFFRRAGYAARPLLMGLAMGAGMALRLPAEVAATVYPARAGGIFLLAAAGGMLLVGASLFLPAVRDSFTDDGGALPHAAVASPGAGRMAAVTLACCLFIYILFGITDALFTGAPANAGGGWVAFRVAQCLLNALAGVLCYRFGRSGALVAGIAVMGLGLVANQIHHTGAWVMAGVLVNVFGLCLFLVAGRALFADISHFSRYPATLTALGVASYFLFQTLGLPIAAVMQNADRVVALSINLVLYVLAIPLVMLLFAALRTAAAQKEAAQTPPITPGPEKPARQAELEKFPLTKREKEIFKLVLQGQTPDEIAQGLFVTESTVNWHIANILKKTGQPSRAKLVEKYRGNGEG